MTAKSRRRKVVLEQKKGPAQHYAITKIEDGDVLRFSRVGCTCPEGKHHFA